MTMRDIQAALAARGYRTGPIDGIFGPQTAAALRAFQADSGLPVDGIAGPMTQERLGFLNAASAFDDPGLVWFQEARRLLGTKERPGAGSNPIILDWADDLDAHYPGDDVPWCGLFAAHCIAATLRDEPLPAGLLRARAYERFGIPTAPMPGAIMVFWREVAGGPRGAASPFGHVGFYAGEDQATGDFRILGGNQSDSVSLAWIARERLVTARWPATVPARPAAAVHVVSRDDALSWREA
ncbi:NlpC/P60 family protein [Sphingomonas adhaesiva]|uniref:NlpC/P60 family protein n=1 Tax=Sphingomonas adhaesiva TaxID=28212 RepID=UPI002FF796E2